MLILHRVHKAIRGPRKGNEVMVECLIKNGRLISGGFTLCDPRDKFDLKKGMDLSFSRAIRQLKGRPDKDRTLPVVTKKAKKTIEDCGFTPPDDKACIFSKQKLLSQACKLEQKFLDV